jgi:hypothetical protein
MFNTVVVLGGSYLMTYLRGQQFMITSGFGPLVEYGKGYVKLCDKEGRLKQGLKKLRALIF